MILLVKENQLLVFVHNCILWVKINRVALFVTKFSRTLNSTPENIMLDNPSIGIALDSLRKKIGT